MLWPRDTDLLTRSPVPGQRLTQQTLTCNHVSQREAGQWSGQKKGYLRDQDHTQRIFQEKTRMPLPWVTKFRQLAKTGQKDTPVVND